MTESQYIVGALGRQNTFSCGSLWSSKSFFGLQVAKGIWGARAF